MITKDLEETIITKGTQCNLVKYTNHDLGDSEWYRVDVKLDNFGLDTVYFHFTNVGRAVKFFELLENAIIGYE